MALWLRGSTQLAITLSSLKHRNFRLLFCGTSLSHVGDFIQAMAQSWLVWQMTKSPFLLGIVGFAQALPRLLLGAVGGAIVDRVERRRLLLCTQFLAMAQAFTFWALVQFGGVEFWHVLVLVLFLGTVNSLNQTARHSLINNIVPREDLMNAIALNSSLANLAKIIGPSLGGVLIGVIGVAGCLLVNAVSFLAIIVTLVVMEIPPGSAKVAKATPFWQEVVEGYRFLRSERRLLSVILLTYGVAMVGTPYSRFLPGVRHRRASCRADDVRFVARGARGGRCVRRVGDRIAWSIAPTSPFRRHGGAGVLDLADALFVFPLDLSFDVLSYLSSAPATSLSAP